MAISQSLFSDIGGGVSDIFNFEASGFKAEGAEKEASAYRVAATLAGQNEQFEEQSTAVKQTQANRQIYLGLGATKADVTGGGLSMSGSALDILRSGAQQGALQKQVLGQQGLINEAGYEEQKQSYDLMAQAADVSAKAAKESGIGSLIGGALKFGAAAALFI